MRHKAILIIRMKILLHPAGLALLGACAFAAPPISATAAGFDCAKAHTTIEVTICETPALSELDTRLSVLYKEAVRHDPQIKETQRRWLSTVRNRCADQACLTAAYEQQIGALENLPWKARGHVSETAANLLPSMVDVTYFYGVSDLSLESLLLNPDAVLFGKKIIHWTNDDFTLLEQKLTEQIAIERDAAAVRQNKISDMGYQGRPVEEDHDYSFRKGVLNTVIASISTYQYLAREARTKHVRDLAAAEAEQRKQQVLKAQEEARLKAESRASEEQQVKAQTHTELSNVTWTLLALLALAIGGWIWNTFIRLRCVSCKSTKIDTLSIKQLDRWRGPKQVTERHSRGTNTRYVSTVYVKNQYHYECRDCGEDWAILRKEEL
jgi:hypothetical protein